MRHSRRNIIQKTDEIKSEAIPNDPMQLRERATVRSIVPLSQFCEIAGPIVRRPTLAASLGTFGGSNTRGLDFKRTRSMDRYAPFYAPH